VLSTGYDILFFWVARMMMFGPVRDDGVQAFDELYLHGLVRDGPGQEDVQSKGNVIDPLEWLEQYGADALRFTLARGANPGSDQAIAEEWGLRLPELLHQAVERHPVRVGQRAHRGYSGAAARGADRRGPVDPGPGWTLWCPKWTDCFEDFQFAKLCDALYHFTWDEFCDWYLELAKVQIAAGRVDGTRAVLGHVLDVLLRLMHPVIRSSPRSCGRR